MSRPTRSASIPIGPRSPSSLTLSRNIENAIPISFAPSSRPRLPSQQLPQRSSTVDDQRGLGVSYGTRGSGSSAATHSSARPTARSMTVGSAPGRGSFQSLPTYEPRVVRAAGQGSHNVDATCIPSTSPSHTRRTSGAGARGTSASRPHPGYTTSPSHPSPVAFPRPSYLDYSALRHMLHTDAPPTLPPSRKAEPATREPHSSSTILDSDEESNVSPPRELPSTPLPTLSQARILRLPTRWSDQWRHNLLSVSADGRDLTYHGASCSGEKDAAAARTVQSIPPACGIYYYETEIISKGQKGHISIGFAGPDVKLSRLPGWEPNSWGYHGDDGCSFAAEKNGTKYGPTFGTGDIIGCGVDFTTHAAFFTRNGTLIGPVFDNIGKNVDLYPSIGMRHTGEAVRVNFGHEPFKFDIDFYVLQQRNNVWSRILERQPDPSLLKICGINSGAPSSELKGALSTEQTREVINELVFSYLEHHGYAKTVKAFEKQREAETRAPQPLNAATTLAREDNDVDMSAPQDDEDPELERRTKIVNAVIAGDVDRAIEDTKTYHPTVLQAEEGLMLFKLRCRKFVELILEAAELKKKIKSGGPETAAGTSTTTSHDEGVIENMDSAYTDGMDVDEESVVAASHSTTTNGFGSSTVPARLSRCRSSGTAPDAVGMLGNTLSHYESALHQAIAYGQTLSNEYKDDVRPEVRQISKRTFAILAWEDPMNAGGVVAEVVGHSAKVTLANELNQAILKSQGRPPTPLLETLYRRTAVIVSQLGLLGVGGAALADMHKEFLET
ncbi:Ran-binding protein 10 [Termitomyces sp. T112]|nr:Ran-binding protein 10 [Termitomyces sp. T112]